MLRKALCVALSLSLLAATVISSAANTTTEEAMHENGQDVSILDSSRLGCGHYYFASILECLLDFSNESRKYNGIHLRFRIPKDVVLKILSYLAPVKLSDPAQIQTALNSLYRFEKLYGLNRYVDEITIEQINILKSMELELGPFLERNSDICHKLLISRKHVLGSLGFSLSLKLKGLRPSDLLKSLLEFRELSDDQNAIQTAISMFVEEIVKRFDTGDFSGDELLNLNVWILLGTKCYDFGLIRQFAQMLPESLTCSRYFRFLPIVPFEHYPQYLERCTGKNQPTDAELRALSNLLSYCPMIKRNDPDLQPEYFNQYKELIDKYSFSQSRKEMLNAINSIKHGLLNDIVAIHPSLMGSLCLLSGPEIVSLLWSRSDFDGLQKHFQPRPFFWTAHADIVINPKRLIKSTIDNLCWFPPIDLLKYNLHNVSNTTAKADFEAELFWFVEVFADNKKDLASIDQLEMLLYAMDYAYRINNDAIVALACSVIRAQIPSRLPIFFGRMTEMACLPKLWGGPFKHLYLSLCLPCLNSMGTTLNDVYRLQPIKVSIRAADFETLKLLVAFVKGLVLVEFCRNLENNAVLPKHMPQFIDILGYSQDDLLLALCKTSTDSWLIDLFKSAEGSFQGHDKLPRFHSLWYYLWMAHREAFTKNADAALVQFYESRYGN